MKRVLVESPYGSPQQSIIVRNEFYARACLADAFARGEAPFASHLLYTQAAVLRDNDPAERRLGIAAGLLWGMCAELTAVYVDLGITSGMIQGITHAEKENRPIEYRCLSDAWLTHDMICQVKATLYGFENIEMGYDAVFEYCFRPMANSQIAAHQIPKSLGR
jgi:hypothetical protein